MTPNQVLADGWRLTRAILALKCLEIPHTIEFQIDGANHIRATRFATLDELAKAVAALDEAIERRSEGKASVTDLHGRFEIEEATGTRWRSFRSERAREEPPRRRPSSKRFFPTFLSRRKRPPRRRRLSAGGRSARKRRLRSTRKPLRSTGVYAQTLDPYGVLDEWELPEEFHQVGREYFARAPGSDVWVGFGDLPEQTLERLRQRGQSASSSTGRFR